MLKGRLGLETARIPQSDRHGLLWVSRGTLSVENGTIHFQAAGSGEYDAGDYAIPYQTVSMVMMGPGTTISHDCLRLLARHGTGLVATGDQGVRMYPAPPLGTSQSALARSQAYAWADEKTRIETACKLYEWRFGFMPPQRDIRSLRGIEGTRMKEAYRLASIQFRIPWRGRNYDRQNPKGNDDPNQAINYAATVVEAAATIATACTGTISQLGFIHESSANAFCLDIADLYRTSHVIPIAFEAVKNKMDRPGSDLEREVRRIAGKRFKSDRLIPQMIDRIKELFAGS